MRFVGDTGEVAGGTFISYSPVCKEEDVFPELDGRALRWLALDATGIVSSSCLLAKKCGLGRWLHAQLIDKMMSPVIPSALLYLLDRGIWLPNTHVETSKLSIPSIESKGVREGKLILILVEDAFVESRRMRSCFAGGSYPETIDSSTEKLGPFFKALGDFVEKSEFGNSVKSELSPDWVTPISMNDSIFAWADTDASSSNMPTIFATFLSSNRGSSFLSWAKGRIRDSSCYQFTALFYSCEFFKEHDPFEILCDEVLRKHCQTGLFRLKELLEEGHKASSGSGTMNVLYLSWSFVLLGEWDRVIECFTTAREPTFSAISGYAAENGEIPLYWPAFGLDESYASRSKVFGARSRRETILGGRLSYRKCSIEAYGYWARLTGLDVEGATALRFRRGVNQPVLIWGASARGLLMSRVLENFGLEVAGFIDSDRGKLGSCIGEIPVVEFDPYEARAKDWKVVLAVSDQQREFVLDQLGALGMRNVLLQDLMELSYSYR